jgi:flagellar hook-basal body complex protein FliE
MIVGSFPSLPVRELGRAIPAELAAKPDAAQNEASPAKGGGFVNFLEKAVGEVDSKLKSADAEKTKVLTGETTNLHQAVIAMQEAGVAFSLMIEVRNKLVESYQELMRVQV